MKVVFTRSLLVAVAILTIACSKNPLKDDAQARGKEKVGPQQIAFNSSGTYTHSFEFGHGYSSGAVNLFYSSPAQDSVQIETVTAEFYGCPEAQMQLAWFENSAAPQGMRVYKGSLLRNNPGAEAKLQVALLKIESCSSTKFAITLKRLASTPQNSTQFPDEYVGSWSTSSSVGGFSTKFDMLFAKLSSGAITTSYTSNCGSGSESFDGLVTRYDAASNPRRVSIQISRVTREFEGACGNVLALEKADEGRILNCLVERNTQWNSFKIGCKKALNSSDYPQDWYSGDFFYER